MRNRLTRLGSMLMMRTSMLRLCASLSYAGCWRGRMSDHPTTFPKRGYGKSGRTRFHLDYKRLPDCRCPIWVDGTLGGAEIRESLKVWDWQRAQEMIPRMGDRKSPHIPADREISTGSMEGIPSGHQRPQTQRLYDTKIQILEPPNGRIRPTTRPSCPGGL